MNIKKYDYLRHMNDLEDAIKARNLPIKLIQELPRIGMVYIEPNSGKAIAFGFLRLIEGNTGMIDSMITHPDIDPKIRDEALSLITDSLIKEAKIINLSSLIAITKDKNTLLRAHRHGFVSLEHEVIALDLKQ